MSKRQVIMILTVIVVLIQFLGFLPAWREIITLICGVLILGIAFRMAPKTKPADEKAINYIEHKNQ